MFRYRKSVKVISLFVAAFICLNAAGMACLAYCISPEKDAESAHCPLRKLSPHCDKAADDGRIDSASVEADAFECCSMAVSFIAAPVEKHSFETGEVATTSAVKFAPRIFTPTERFLSNNRYRGPPLDLRPERIKHCVLRI